MPTGPCVQAVLLGAMRRYRRQPLIVSERGESSYAEEASRLAGLARWIQAHCEPGARVAIALPNGREFIECLLACPLSARVRVSLGVGEPVETQAAKLRHCTASVVVAELHTIVALQPAVADLNVLWLAVGARPGGALPPHTDRYEDAASAGGDLSTLGRGEVDDLYRMSYTGGTTGIPKAVVLTHSRELAMVRNLLLQAHEPGPGRVFVAATPLAHAAGSFVVPTVLKGGALSWLERFDPERLGDAGRLGAPYGVETFVVPTALSGLLSAPRSDAFHTIVYGGAPCPPAVQELAAELYPDRMVQIYGQTEAPMTICVLDREDHRSIQVLAGSIGYPFTYVDVMIRGADGAIITEPGVAGEVCVRAEHVMAGYWHNESETDACLLADGTLRTSDIGYWDEHGCVRLSGRVRELIISGGFNVHPGEVERRLGAVDGVKHMIVFGVPHPRWGEAVVVAVEALPGVDVDAVSTLVASRAQERLATHERPKHVAIVERVPLTPLGKPSRLELEREFRALFIGER